MRYVLSVLLLAFASITIAADFPPAVKFQKGWKPVGSLERVYDSHPRLADVYGSKEAFIERVCSIPDQKVLCSDSNAVLGADIWVLLPGISKHLEGLVVSANKALASAEMKQKQAESRYAQARREKATLASTVEELRIESQAASASVVALKSHHDSALRQLAASNARLQALSAKKAKLEDIVTSGWRYYIVNYKDQVTVITVGLAVSMLLLAFIFHLRKSNTQLDILAADLKIAEKSESPSVPIPIPASLQKLGYSQNIEVSVTTTPPGKVGTYAWLKGLDAPVPLQRILGFLEDSRVKQAYLGHS